MSCNACTNNAVYTMLILYFSIIRYMGMECTLERGFSLNESAVERELKEERYDELNVDYFSKPFPYKYTSALKHLVPVRKTCK